MRLLPQDEPGLQAALALAEATAGLASPNPTVGCTLTRDGVVLGRGAHLYDRRDHAEVAALKAALAAGHDVRGATAFVTLEPCAHHGRTGPCAEALVQAGIANCIAATVDPNPLVSGQGFVKLRAAGVEVRIAEPSSVLARRARRLNDAFAFAIRYHRPCVTLKAALSVDGKLAPPSASRDRQEPHWLTGPAAREDVQRLRHASDVILTGIGTVLADDPGLTDRTGLPRRRPLLRVLLDPSLRTPLTSKLVRSVAEDLLVVGALSTAACASAEGDLETRAAALHAAGAHVLRLPLRNGTFDLEEVLAGLFQGGRISVLLEGGAGINAAFLTAGLVDRVVFYYAETELGQNAVPFARGAVSPYALQSRLTSVQQASFPRSVGEDVRLSGYLHDPWAGVDGPAATPSL